MYTRFAAWDQSIFAACMIVNTVATGLRGGVSREPIAKQEDSDLIWASRAA
jgi:hypothetical protein